MALIKQDINSIKIALGGNMNKIILTFALLIMLLTADVFAQGIYLGAGIGNTFFSSEVSDAVNQAKEISENSTSWKIFAGYHLTNFLNIEGGYRSFGSISTNVLNQEYKSKTDGWDIEALGRYQILIVDIFGKAGIMFRSTNVTFPGQDSDKSHSDFLWGLGAGVHLGPAGVRLEWESIAVSGPDNLSMVSLSATFGF